MLARLKSRKDRSECRPLRDFLIHLGFILCLIMLINLRFTCLFVLFIGLGSLSLNAQSLYSRHYTISDGLPHNTVFNTFQDRQGFIWMCTDDGLARFDGKNMKVYQKEEGFESSFIINMTEREDGRKFISTWKGGLYILENEKLTKLPTTGFVDINSSKVFYKHDSLLYSRQPYTFSIFKKKGNKWESSILRPHFKDNQLVMNANPNILEGEYDLLYPFTVHVANNTVYLWNILTGLFVWDEATSRLNRIHQDIIGERKVTAFHLDSQNNKWLAVKGKGILKIAPDHHFQWFTEEIPEHKIFNIYSSDYEPKIAFNTSIDGSTEDNMYLFDYQKGILTDLKKELSFTTSPSSFMFDRDGNYWMTTIGEGVYWILNRPYDYYSFSEAKYVHDIIQGDEHNFWVATKSGGYQLNHQNRTVSKYFNKKPVRIVFQHPSSTQPYFSILHSLYAGAKSLVVKQAIYAKPILYKEQQIIGANYNYIVLIDLARKTNKRLFQLNLQGSRRINNILLRDSTLWAASEQGLWKFRLHDEDSLQLIMEQHYIATSNMPSDICYDIKPDAEGVLWVATDRGLASIKNGQLQKVSNFPTIRCLEILIDHRNNLWVATPNGLIHYDRKKYILFQEETGLLANDVNCILEDNKQQLWIGSTKGLTVIDNKSLPVLSKAPTLFFQIPNKIQFTNTEKIRLDFSALNYESPNSTQYRYRLNNRKWQYTTNSFIEYNALTADEYHFEIQAKKTNSVWSVPQRFHFRTVAPWYLHPVVIFLEVLLFVALVIWIARARIIKATTVSKRLRSEIDQRILMEKQLAEVRNQIARDFHDEMGNKLASITVLSNLISFKLANPSEDIAELLNKIEQSSKQLYRGTKDFIWSIDTKSDNVMELFTYLRDFGETFYQPIEMDFYVETKEFEKFEHSQLPLHWSRQIVLIFKEAMTNVAKYAESKAVWFHFELVGDQLMICLKDNGKGFDLKNKKTGHGLRNMKERAARIACELEIISTNEGTEVRFYGNMGTKPKL